MVYFRGTDEAGNMSEVTSFEVNNIDKITPEKPTASADILTPTNKDVTVTAEFSADSVRKEYSFDGDTWIDYTADIVFSENGMVFFRGTDEAGNKSEITACAVNNIDKVAPEKPTASASITAITNQDVFVTAAFSDDTFAKEYSLDGEEWFEYIGAVKLSENGTVFFRGTDEAGNISEVERFAVTNIDKVAPEKPVASADVTKPTNGDVLVSAVFSDDSVRTEYSRDGQIWYSYAEPVRFGENGTAYFRGTDEAGNISEVMTCEVNNIDKTAPEKPMASANITTPTNQDVLVTASFSEDTLIKEYSLDGATWNEYDESIRFEENGFVFFRGTDEAGNTSGISIFTVNNIDKVAPAAPFVTADVTTITAYAAAAGRAEKDEG